ncbi:18545_t:CDS:1, partial [Racocetra fulgida]
AETSDEEENWSNVIENWVGMLDSENRLENGEIVDDELPEFEFGGRTTHPADDSLAK